jgi:hypothetical protein
MPNDARVATAGQRLLSAIALGREKVWFAPAAIEAEPGRAGWRELVKASRAAGAVVLAVQPPGTMTGGGSSRDLRRPVAAADACVLRPVAAKVIRYRADEVVLSVDAPSDGWILFNDRWARGWRGSVDGKDVPVWGGNFIFRAVRVSAGARTIRFVYRPFGYPWLLALSWGILFAVAAGALRRNRRGTGVLPNSIRLRTSFRSERGICRAETDRFLSVN